jgi:predicted DsbA family dithiol-disulfide isomerase
VAAIHAYFYTDPACPWSWSIEPALRRMEVEFGPEVELRPVMGGLAREFGPALGIVAEWLAAADAGAMPVDPRLWLESPPRSSYPACLAVKAAGEQGREVQSRYLRVLRRGFACERRRLDHADALLDAARESGGLDLERLRVDLGSHAILEAFGADLDRAAQAGARAGGEGRVRTPSLEFVAAGGEVHGVYGPQPPDRYREAAVAAGAQPRAEPAPGVEEALRRLGPLAAAEVAAVCDLPGPRASAELWRLAGEWRVRFERRLTGELWYSG